LGQEKRKIAKDVVREFNEHLNTSFSEKEKATLVKFLKKINEVATNYSPVIQIEP